MHVDISLLGGFAVVVDGRAVAANAWGRRSAATLVKVLALRPGRQLPRERLVDLLWPDLLLEQAAPRLHKAAHYARTAVGIPSAVVLAGDVVALLPGAEVTVDVERFDRAAGDPSSVGDAIDLYRGDLLPEDLYEPWADAERQRLRVCYLQLLRAAGRWAELLVAEPLDEEAHLRLVQQHVESGDRGQALRQLDAMARLWRDELGAEPGPAARALHARAQAMPPVEPSALAPGSGSTRVPRPATPTVGREDDVAAVVSLLEDHRLVTLLGVGGVGKTRLAAEVAHAYGRATPHRTAYVDLTKVADAGLVAELAVSELGIRSGDNSNVVQMLHEALQRQDMLLVLDNFEHVVEAADLVSEMLQWSADLRVLVTSRARLRVAGEHVYEVHPLTVDGDEGLTDAVALFEQVATAVDPHFELGHHTEDVVAICRAVDGLPLAIEIAGGHLRTLSPALLRERLTSRLGSAAAAGRDLPDRQQTIPAAIDWSLQLLGPAEQRLFGLFSLFHGAVPLEAVEAVWADGDVVDPLSVLVDHSLVRRTTGYRNEPRFGMLSLVREHAARLVDGDRDAGRAAHAAFFASYLDDLYERRWTDATYRWLDDIGEMLHEVRAAHAWAAREGDLTLTASITASLGAYWFLEGNHAEGLRWIDEMLAVEDQLDPLVSARIRLAAGFMAFPSSRPEARTHWERATGLFRDLGETRLVAYGLAVTSATYIDDDERIDLAMQTNDEALELGRGVGSPALVAQVLNIRGELTRVAGRDEEARAAYEEGLQISSDLDDELYVSVFLSNLSYLADHRGDHEEARRLTHRALRICWSQGRRLMAAWTVSQLAGPEHALGRPELGAVLIGAGDEALRVLGARRHPGDVPEHDRVVAAIRAALGDERFEELRSEGARMTLDEALDLVLDRPRVEPARGMTDPDYRHLPAPVRLDDTIAEVDPEPPRDPEGDGNRDHYRALRDD
ncbi:AAA family ATPase [Nocardioides sp. zg-1308]|uniref:ATP-binding protein n=1 Tax=Nocardioides sp. zg-1308 TaxID=2736253 RepID=UPI001554069A|nr:NB-ARC domain-containing protein [Nocardioides sp. zg-1308]NPD05623.1 AAA family ATPase [Nocardioides sp. zg-1308]